MATEATRLQDGGKAPLVLTVVMVDTWRTTCAVVHEQEWLPYRRRTVHIRLTDEQRELLRPQLVGMDGRRPVYEEIGGAWLEWEEPTHG